MIMGKSIVQDNTLTLTCFVLGRVQDFWGQDCRVVRSSGFAKRYVPIILTKLIVRV